VGREQWRPCRRFAASTSRAQGNHRSDRGASLLAAGAVGGAARAVWCTAAILAAILVWRQIILRDANRCLRSLLYAIGKTIQQSTDRAHAGKCRVRQHRLFRFTTLLVRSRNQIGIGRPLDDAKKVLPGLGRLVFRLASIAKVQAISLIAGGTIVLWVRQWPERSYRSGQETDRVMAGRWKHRLTAAVSVRVDCLESAPVMSSPVRRGLDGGHKTATAVELGWCRRAQSGPDGQDQPASAHGLKFLRRLRFSRFHAQMRQAVCEKSTALAARRKNAGDWLAGVFMRETIGGQRYV
jgi:hypothetical protein